MIIISENINSYPHRLSAALADSAASGNYSRVNEIITSGEYNSGSIEDYIDGIALVKKAKVDTEFLISVAQRHYPMAVAFGASRDDPPRMLKEFDQSQLGSNGIDGKAK